MTYQPAETRYDSTPYRNCGRSGLRLSPLTLGLWHNWGGEADYAHAREMTLRAFDLGITTFDNANNYGPPPGSAEETLGRILKEDLGPWRDEIVITTKAGYGMYPGPYGDGGSRKYLLSSVEASLRRLQVDTIDIFYHHRPCPFGTPLEETMGALDQMVKSGKALYIGLSNYSPEATRDASRILRDLGTPCLIHQPRFSLMDRWAQHDLFPVLEEEGIGAAVFCPLEQGILAGRYLEEIPKDSRAASTSPFLHESGITADKLEKVRRFAEIAAARGQTCAQAALAWVLQVPAVTSAIIGASRVSQIEDNVKTLENLDFTESELQELDALFVD